jgi:hypothetical protein
MFYRNTFIVCWLMMSATVNAQLKISTGTVFKTTGGAVITVQNMDLVNDGTISQSPGEGMFRFSGTQPNNISGAGTFLFDVMEISKSAGVKLTLNHSLSIGTSINFNSGLIDLNANNILLQSSALLNGESETSHIMGNNGGFIEATRTLNAPVGENPGNLGAIITSSQNMGNTLVRRSHQSQTNGSGSGNSILRYYDIVPATNTGLNATLRFRYLDAELNGLNEPALGFWKSNNNVTWSYHGFNGRNTAGNFVEKTAISDFARWTLSSSDNALPVAWGSFNTRCENNKVILSWQTLQESNTQSFFVQRSTNGANWINIAQLNAAGQSNAALSYTYTDNQPAGGLYRIVQTDIDSRQTFSPVLRSNCDEKSFFTVYPNPAQHSVILSSYAEVSRQVTIQLYDSKGSLIKRQQANLQRGMNQLIIDLSLLPAGAYNLIASWPGERMQSVKLIKQ